MIDPKYIAERIKRSLQLRTRSAKRLLSGSCKRFYRTADLHRISILQSGPASDNRADFLRAEDDAVWHACPKTTVVTKRFKFVTASEGARNKPALEASLSETCFEAPALTFARLHDCVADPTSIRLVTRNGALISETATVHDILDPHYKDAGHLIDREGAVRQLQKAHKYVDEDVIFAFNAFCPSFGHYVLTSLPIISSFLEDIKSGSLKVVVPQHLPLWMISFLYELGLNEPDLLYLPNVPHRFRTAIASNILDASNTRAPNPNSVWRPTFTQGAPIETASMRRILVRRSDSGNVSSRTICNEAEMLRAVESKGFQIIEPARMRLREQIDAFQYADVIVSPHGSTFANLVFCRPGTRVLDLMPDSWVGIRGDALRDVWASRMCAVSNLDYSVLLCPSKVQTVHFTGNAALASRVSIPDLVDCIDRL